MGEVLGTVIFNTCAVARPTARDYWRGARSAFNLSGSTRGDFHFASHPSDADDAAVTNDWAAVNDDLSGCTAAHTR